jgi:hypothetical protein
LCRLGLLTIFRRSTFAYSVSSGMQLKFTRGNIPMTHKKWNIEQKVLYLVILLFAIFFLLPFVLFGKNSIVTVHDYLDSFIPWYKMYKDNALFFKFDSPTKGFSELSTLYYALCNFSLLPMLYYLFDDFIAYTISIYISIFLGFFSMYLLLKKIGSMETILIVLVSVCYAILPVSYGCNIGVSTMPLIITVFIHFSFRNKCAFSWKVLFLLFFPFFSYFAAIGIFILGFWFLGLIIFGIKDKRINTNLLIGFILLCIGYILIDLRLFYVMFVLKTQLNRSIFNLSSLDSGEKIKVLLNSLRGHFLHGHYHVTSFQRKIIVPFAFLVSVFCLIKLIRRMISQSGSMLARIKTAVAESSFHEKLLFILEFIVFIFALIAALYDSKLLNGFIVKYIPILAGFNWGRVWVFNRVIWYVIFALCLQFVLEINLLFVLKIKINNFFWKIRSCSFIPRLCVGILIVFQLLYISLTPVYYNDQLNTYSLNTNLIKLLSKIGIRNIYPVYTISYKEFFAKNMFEKIKKDISYSDEKVVAFGYHPSVLMYNGFNCIDGYNNAYPLSYMRRFRSLIAPELEINQWAREYYDNWGGRMYLYNSELSYQPTRDKNTLPVKLNIDMDVFKNDFKGKYILSRAEISNSDTLGLELVKRYYDEESIYTIYLYQAM